MPRGSRPTSNELCDFLFNHREDGQQIVRVLQRCNILKAAMRCSRQHRMRLHRRKKRVDGLIW